MKREKVYIAAIACCCWMTTACESSSSSSDDMTPVEGATSTERAIGFVPRLVDAESMARLTRAEEKKPGEGQLTTELLQQKGFGVYCWYTDTCTYDPVNHPEITIADVTKVMLMQNQRVTYSGTLWTYSPAKYWPLADNEKLTFRAYAPYVSYQLQTDKGMPLLPVVVTKDDYHNGTQHDPLWGTGRLVQGSSDTTPGEYYPKAPEDPNQNIYGQHYNNMTYKMSGDYRLKNDTYDGTIDWYFHHGMAALKFTCSVIANPGCKKVVIRSISISPLYKMGLLDLSSPTANKDDKPLWYERDGDMIVELKEGTPNSTAGDLKARPETPYYPFVIETDPTAPTDPAPLLEKNLLIIPRNFEGTNQEHYDAEGATNPGLEISVEYSIDDEDDVQTAVGYITTVNFKGNTHYTIGLSLTPATKGLAIDIVRSAFTPWQEGDPASGSHTVYNW